MTMLKAGIFLKKLIRIAVICFAVLLIFYMVGNRTVENEPLEAPTKNGEAIPMEEKGVGTAIPQTSRPKEGLSTYVGKHIDELIEVYGEPNRIEPSHYHYDWWIFKEDVYLMVGVTHEQIINQLYTGDDQANISPFEMHQGIEDIYRFSIIGSEVDVNIGDNIYTFTLNSEDMHRRPLIIYQDLFAQLYIDEEDGQLQGVRFIDPETLVLQRPYDMTYMGELLVSKPLSSTTQSEANEAIRHQLFELVNFMRTKHQLGELQSTETLDQFAQSNSERLAIEENWEDAEVKHENLLQRLKSAQIEHKKAGENTAFDYDDAIEAVHGWLNSNDHRKTLLTKDYTHMGTGVYGNYFTQTFIKSAQEYELHEQ